MIPSCFGLDTFWRADNRQWVYTVAQLVNWKNKSASESIVAPIMFFIYVNKIQNNPQHNIYCQLSYDNDVSVLQ